ncbi:hypothetical protein [Weizmannia acidilactici]|uniref:hypothetical protein n=1 Tax=Weizmannia acidilactici TaxID=2607726 RepID=UPI0020A2F2FF|nr:hypothetical protein [Weizmannia acidilactici]
MKIGTASALMGTKTILVGISPSMSLAISSSGLDFSRFDCFQTLQHSIHYAHRNGLFDKHRRPFFWGCGA